ncbi:hypothetical protein HK096_001372 [Nowakowskiella sp. JEL0078]|nr:hypothetical protein HK096_001372 [Nowakowskiella sp. JEL0078]
MGLIAKLSCLLLLYSVTEADSTLTVLRSDANPDRPWEKRWSSQTLQAAHLDASLKLASASVSPLANPFTIVSSCKISDTVACANALATLKLAAAKITSAFTFFQEIRVSVQFTSLCQSSLASCDSRILGGAAPASYFDAKTSSDSIYYSYPQALLKQLNIQDNVQIPYNDFDIVALFNMDANWRFSSTNYTNSTQYDFERVAIHELSHGLGFDSSVNQWSDGFTFIGPSYKLNNESNFNGWLSPTLMDRYIYIPSSSKKWMDMLKLVTSFTTSKKLNETQFLMQFSKSGDPFSAAQQLYIVCTTSSKFIQYRTAENMSIYLQTTPGNFLQGTSIVHVDQATYSASAEFLMTPEVPLDNLSIEPLIAKYNASYIMIGPYGVQTLNILKHFGYATPDNLTRATVTVNLLNSINTTTSSATSAFACYDFLLITFIALIIINQI